MDAKKKRKIKRLMGLIVPILVLVVTVSVVGASFAWFSQSSGVSIATIDMSVESFTLEFVVPEEYSPYQGQTGFDADGKLITDGNNVDKPYEFSTDVRFNVNPDGIDLAVSFVELQIGFFDDNDNLIESNPHIVVSLDDDEHNNIDDIRYGFTWKIVNYTTGGTIYAPYGSGDGVGSNTPNWSNTPIQQSIKGFKAKATDECKFVIVFCPEKLYWMQYSTATDKAKSFNEVYSEETVAEYICGENGYTNNIFQGADFRFKVRFERA